MTGFDQRITFLKALLFLVLLFLLHVTSSGPAFSQTRNFRTGTIKLDYTGPKHPYGGLIPVDITVDPSRKNVTFEIKATGKSKVMATVWERSAKYSPKHLNPERITLLCPAWPRTESISIMVSDNQGESGQLATLRLGAGRERTKTNFLIAGSRPGQIQQYSMDVDEAGRIYPPYLQPVALSRLWSDWRALSAFDAVFVPWNDLKSASPDTKQTLFSWLASGGNLVLTDVPADVKQQKQPPGEWLPSPLSRTKLAGDTQSFTYLEGLICLLGSERSAELRNYFRKTAGRGTSPGNLSRFSLSFLRNNRFQWWNRNGWKNPGSGRGASPVIPDQLMIDELRGIPVLTGLGLLFVFVTIIGPANYLYLKHKKKISLLVVTIPLLSIFATSIIFAWDFLKHGLGSDVRSYSLMTIHNTENRAVQQNRYLLHMGLSPSRGLKYQPSTLVDPLMKEGEEVSQTTWLHMQSDAQYLNGEPASARTPHYLESVQQMDFRGRLQIQRLNDNTYKVTNGLGFDLHVPVLVDRNGTLYAPGGLTGKDINFQDGTTKKFSIVSNHQVKQHLSNRDLAGYRKDHMPENPFKKWWFLYPGVESNKPKPIREFNRVHKPVVNEHHLKDTRMFFGIRKNPYEMDFGIDSYDYHGAGTVVVGTHWQTDSEQKND